MFSHSSRLRLSVVSLAVFAAALLAAPKPAAAKSLPDFDVSNGARGTLVPGDSARNGNGVALGKSGRRVMWNVLTGTASRVSHAAGTLTQPSSDGPETVSRKFVSVNPDLFKLSVPEANGLKNIRQYHTEGLNLTQVTLQQQFNSIPVFTAEMAFHVDDRGALAKVSGLVVPNLAGTIRSRQPKLSAEAGLKAALKAAGMNPETGARLEQRGKDARQSTTFSLGNAFFRKPLVQLSYIPVSRNETALAWDTALWVRGTHDVYHELVDANTGQLLFRKNYTAYAGPQGQVYDQESPQPGTPYLGVTPAVVNRVTLPFNGNAFFAPGDSHRDWWNGVAATTTFGNNCQAGSMRDGVTLTQTNASGSDFSFPCDLTQDPKNYQDAAVTNLFYWTNISHDFWYGFGYNEAAGNAQLANFGKGGAGNDYVQAAAQLEADANPPSTDNAFMATPPDGTSPFTGMFVWDITNPQRDGDLCSEIMLHEYMHSVSNRLIGNANGLTGFQGGAMGEGWSDFAALMVQAQSLDDTNLPYPLGGYVVNDFPAGIRSQPYSANQTIFTRTYKNISDPVFGGPEVHLAGEIMTDTLFNMYALFKTRLGFNVGRRRAEQLFIDALKLTPNNPTFLDYRDAVVQADSNRFAGADLADIWKAFAQRGMGLSASTTGGDDTNPKEAFDQPTGFFNISGTVTNGGTPVSGVKITVGTVTATTASDGTYKVKNLGTGLHTVVPSKTGFGFTPPTQDVTIVDQDITGVDFAASFSISGTITENGNPLAGVSVTAGGVTVPTAADGTYSIDGLFSGIYTVSASLQGYLFSPASQQVVVGPNATKVNFTATRVYLVSGTITEAGFGGLPGVTVTAGTQTATTAADGTYSMLLPAATYQITPTKDHYTFNVAFRTVTVGPDATGIDFIGTHVFAVSGKVTLNNLPFFGVTVSAGGLSTTTALDGTYNITGLSTGSYTVAASRAGYIFSPASTSVSLVSQDATDVNFTAQKVFSLSGKITQNGVGVANVDVSVGGKPVQTAVDGTYSFSALVTGTYTVTPSKAGFTFTPVNRSVSLSSDTTGVDFTAVQSFTISGIVKIDGAAASGVAVTLNTTPPRNATTGTDGSYSFTGVVAGTYTVTPLRPNVTFNPVSSTIQVVDTDYPDVNFNGTQLFNISGIVTEDGDPLAGVTISAGTRTATTAVDGTYTIGGLTAGSYTVSASFPSTSFAGGGSVTVGPDQGGVDFVATQLYSISGKVTVNGAPLSGVQVGAGAATATTAGDGTYTINGVTKGIYAVTPLKAGYTFQPGSTTLEVGPDATNINFSAVQVFSISGRVTKGGVPLSGVAVKAGDQTATTAGDGTYTIGNLFAITYTVRASAPGVSFTPDQRSVTLGSNATNIDFAAGSSISGTVTSGGAPLAGATVKLSTVPPQTVNTGADGTYRFSGVADGTYNVSVAANGAVFSPSTKSVTVAPNASDVDFDATTVPTLASVSVSPGSVRGGGKVQVTVTFTQPNPKPVSINLSSTNAGIFPAKVVTLKKNLTTATYTVKTGKVSASTNLTIRATANGVTQTTQLTVTPH